MHNDSTLARHQWRRPLLVAIVIVALALLSACGGTPARSAGASGSSQAPGQPGTQPGTPPGTVGSIAAINGSQLEVQNPATGQVTVTYSSSTAFSQTVPATIKDLATGDCVAVSEPRTAGSSTPLPTPTAATGSLTAGVVRIFQPVSGTCTNPEGIGGFGRGGGFGFGRRRPGSFSPRPGGFRFRNVFGKATSVSASTMVVDGIDRRSGTAMTTDVTLVSTTTYTKVVRTTSNALAVGKCVVALGPSDDTGAIAATSISISTPGPNGCFGAFGGGGGGGGGGNG